MQHRVISAALPFGVGLDEVFLPQYLKEQDYQTHAIGKVIKVYIVVTVPFAGLHLIADCGVFLSLHVLFTITLSLPVDYVQIMSFQPRSQGHGNKVHFVRA